LKDSVQNLTLKNLEMLQKLNSCKSNLKYVKQNASKTIFGLNVAWNITRYQVNLMNSMIEKCEARSNRSLFHAIIRPETDYLNSPSDYR
jgi:hypothetical protein